MSGEPLADDREARAQVAADLCPAVILPCRSAGAHEKFGIWGGIDRTLEPAPHRPASRKVAKP